PSLVHTSVPLSGTVTANTTRPPRNAVYCAGFEPCARLAPEARSITGEAVWAPAAWAETTKIRKASGRWLRRDVMTPPGVRAQQWAHRTPERGGARRLCAGLTGEVPDPRGQRSPHLSEDRSL